MPARFLVLAVVFAWSSVATTWASEAVSAAAPAAPAWSVTVGAGALTAPSYPGASSRTAMPLPFIEVKYRRALFLSPFTGLGFNAIATRRAQAGVAVLPDFGRSDSSSDRLRGWGDIGAGASLKVFGRYSLGPVALVADVRQQVGAGGGTLLGGGLTSMVPLARRLAVMPTVKLTWASARHSDAYFGIDAGQSAAALAHGTSLPAYAADAGLRDAALSLAAALRLDDRWSLQALLRAELLLGDAAASPLVERRFQPTAGALVAYRL